MRKNPHTCELIDIFTPNLTIKDKDFGIFIVMEYVDSDLKKMMTQKPRVELTEGHVL